MRTGNGLLLLLGLSCQGVGPPPGAIIEYRGDVEILLTVYDAETRAPLTGVTVCEYYDWIINGQKCAPDSIFGVTDSDGKLVTTVSTLNGSVDAILVKGGYEPLHVHGVAQTRTGGHVDFGRVLLARKQ